jgi:hypothetical protein
MSDEKICDQCDVPMQDSYFGVCPTCHKTDGYMNIGKGHWFICKEHRVTWFIGANLFSSWQYETEQDQRRQYDELGMSRFARVESHNYKETDDSGEVATNDI